jgi:EpsI family protein
MNRSWVFGTVLAIMVAADMTPTLFPGVRPIALPTGQVHLLPDAVGPWRASSVEERLSGSGFRTFQRSYIRDGDDVVTLEIRHYPGGVPHSPFLLLPEENWERSLIEVVSVDPGTSAVVVNRVTASTTVALPDRRSRTIVYWYHERGRIVAKETWAKLYQVWGRLLRRPVDGALVSVSTDTQDVQRARQLVTEFARLALPTLTKALLASEGVS